MKVTLLLCLLTVGCGSVQECLAPCLVQMISSKEIGKLDNKTKDNLVKYFNDYSKLPTKKDDQVKENVGHLLPKSKAGLNDDVLLNLGIDLGLKYFICMLECAGTSEEKELAKQKILQFDRIKN